METASDKQQAEDESFIHRIIEAKRESNGCLGFFKALSAIIFGTIGCTILLGSVLVIPIAMIVVGSIHLDDCPIEPYIPIFMIVSGFYSLLEFSKKIFLKCLQMRRGTPLTLHPCITLIGVVVQIFQFAWFIAGCVWVYRSYEPDYEDEKSLRYCDKSLYLFAFWLLTIAYIVTGLCLVVFCVIAACAVTTADSD